MISILKFSEGVIVRWPVDSGIENPEFLQRGKVIIHNHAPASHDRHLPHFSGVQPTAVDDGCSLPAKVQAHGCHVLDTRGDMSTAHATDTHRLFPNQVLDNRYIMRSKVPSDIDVFLEKTQVKTAGGDI